MQNPYDAAKFNESDRNLDGNPSFSITVPKMWRGLDVGFLYVYITFAPLEAAPGTPRFVFGFSDEVTQETGGEEKPYRYFSEAVEAFEEKTGLKEIDKDTEFFAFFEFLTRSEAFE